MSMEEYGGFENEDDIAPNRIVLCGYKQQEFAIRALNYTGANPMLASMIEMAVAFDKRINNGHEFDLGYGDELGDDAHRDIVFSLTAMGQDPNLSEADQQIAHDLLASLQEQQGSD